MKTTINDFQKKYTKKLDNLDLELLLAFVLKKNKEFVLAHPEHGLTARQAEKFENLAKRRLKHEPIAYILGHKEFYGLEFKVTPSTLIPRPETELLVDETLDLLRSTCPQCFAKRGRRVLRNKPCNKPDSQITIIDVGTGSGNIIVSIAKTLEEFCHPRACGDLVAHQKVSTIDSRMRGNDNCFFYGIDISEEVLRVARHNAKKNNVDKKIKFLQSDLLKELISNTKYQLPDTNLFILANLPYLSQEIYSATSPDVKRFEPKSALYSPKHGLHHYEELLKQFEKLKANGQWLRAILEISPEQKPLLRKMIGKYFPDAKIIFKKDLAKRTRIAVMNL